MKTRSLVAFLGLLSVGSCLAAAQSANGDTNAINVLRAEVRRLSTDLLQHRAEFSQWKIHWIKTELQRVQAERQRLMDERQSIEREIGELNQASANSPGAGDEGRRVELNTIQAPTILAGERAATERESALSAALSAENALAAEIQKQLLTGQKATSSSNQH